ncbi:MAG: ACR3 family arsenite efflux transporter [Dehalococcoidia bacterium]|nr:arsenical-resistance protein [Chloroflexota bacterium]MAU24998.1 arsenical-resistance protein [Chloroflexota bacterium]RZP13324.1 MAG: ACR3 family arsenite efflux transporter [Chloroflexota bacterium]
MGIFEKFLSIWVALSIATGTLLGYLLPGFFEFIATLEYQQVNFLIAILIWVMIFPMMVNIDFSKILDLRTSPKGLFLTLIINWIIKPFTMAMLGILFFEIFFENIITPEDSKQYIAGMILLGVAPCTAMVFVWSSLTKGDPNYTLLQVSVNDIIMIFAFAPIAAFYLGVTSIEVPWDTLMISVLLYVLMPLLFGIFTRKFFLNENINEINKFNLKFKPFIVQGLLLTVILLFGFQGEKIINSPLLIFMIAIPLIIQTYGIFFLAYFCAYMLKLPQKIAAPACLIGTSNFFELAVAVSIAIFGINSGAALTTVVGVLVEVPVMLSLVYILNRTSNNFPIK